VSESGGANAVAVEGVGDKNLRWWIWAYVAVLSAGLGLTLAFSRTRLPGLYLVYLAIACTFVPLPTTPLVLLAAGQWNPVLVAFSGAAASTIANLNEYHVWTSFFRYRLFRRIRESPHCAAATAWFDKAPFAALLAVNIVPLPVDVVRLLAVARQYDRRRFVLANFIGRAARYGLIALIGWALELNLKAIIAITLVAACIGAVKAFCIGRKSNLEPADEKVDR